ncbi:adipocyte enhancer-binding protein 1 [Synchiropus picturatus]
MRDQTGVGAVVLLALCCLLLPRRGDSAGGIVSFQQTREDQPDSQLDLSLDRDDGQMVDSEGLRRTTRDTPEVPQTGRVRRAPQDGKKKKDKKKNKEPKDPGATKKPKSEKKGKKKDKQKITTTTQPPTTTASPTEPPTEPETYTDYSYPDIEDDYWKSEDDYWEADPTPAKPQPETQTTDLPYSYWNPDEEGTAATVTDEDGDYWKPEEKDPYISVTDGYDDYWKPDEKEPEPTPTDIYDDYWKPDEVDPVSTVTDNYDDYWTPEEKDPYASVTDSYSKAVEPTPPAPEVDGNAGTDDSDYWDATFEVPDNLPFPDGKEVSPEITVENLPEEATSVPPTETWYDDYDDYSSRKVDEAEEKWMERERERAAKEREREAREREERLREAEERAKKRPKVFKEPKKCPPLGMESHKIESDQLSASSVSQYSFSPQRARLNTQGSDDEDNVRGGAWCANTEDRIHWFEIDARRETEFTGVITQGRNSKNETDYVTSYFLAFSNDSREWTTIHDGYTDWLFFGNSDAETPVMNQLAAPVLARYIRIIPQSWNGTLCMRLEVLGCPLPDQDSVLHRLNEVTPVDYLEFKHHSYSEMISRMKAVHEECPSITHLYSLGRSSGGREIMAMIISGNPTEHEIGEPEFRYTAGLHGNEAVGREMLLLLMQYLCKEYKDRNPRAQRLVEGIRIHLVPSLNPDGHERAFEFGSELSSWTTGHFTEDGFDIFQNFPDLNTILWDAEDKGLVPKVTPNHHVPIPENMEANSSIAVETRAIISWMRSYPFVLGANFQGGERIVAYPFDSFRLNKPPEDTKPHSRKKRQYEEEEPFDVTAWGRGYQEEPEEDWRDRGYAEPAEDWQGQGYDRGYDRGHDPGYDHGYDHRQDPGYDHGYGQREEEEDTRGGGYQYSEPEDEPRAIPDESLFRWLAISYASTHLAMMQNFHTSCQGDTAVGGHGIVNRAKWRPVSGSMNDFSYLHTNCLELSMFLGCDKFPHQSDLSYEWEKNREAMLVFMEQVHRGIRGIVKDQLGNPIANATVSVEGINHDVTTAPSGDYWRLLNPGEYRVTVRAEGFSPETKLCVVGYQSGATTCSFNLAKSNWDRIKQIMALHGNKPIRLLSNGNRRPQYPLVLNSNRRVVSRGSHLTSEQQRRLRIARLRRLRQLRLLKLRSMTTTTLPPTTTTTTIATTPVTTQSWYNPWFIGEGQSSTPGGFTDSILDYNYEYKIDDY